MHFIGLHGFLGSPQDFDLVARYLDNKIIAPALFGNTELGPQQNFKNWSESFFRFIQKIEGPKILLGYSLGGRLALEFCSRWPQVFEQVHFLSSNVLGVQDFEKRKEWDQKWAYKFLHQDWNLTLKEWNRLPVFEGSAPNQSKESDFVRQELSWALENWSPRHHKLDVLISIPAEKTYFYVGEKDSKYLKIMRNLPHQYQVHLNVIPGLGHRLLAEGAQAVAKRLMQSSNF